MFKTTLVILICYLWRQALRNQQNVCALVHTALSALETSQSMQWSHDTWYWWQANFWYVRLNYQMSCKHLLGTHPQTLIELCEITCVMTHMGTPLPTPYTQTNLRVFGWNLHYVTNRMYVHWYYDLFWIGRLVSKADNVM